MLYVNLSTMTTNTEIDKFYMKKKIDKNNYLTKVSNLTKKEYYIQWQAPQNEPNRISDILSYIVVYILQYWILKFINAFGITEQLLSFLCTFFTWLNLLWTYRKAKIVSLHLPGHLVYTYYFIFFRFHSNNSRHRNGIPRLAKYRCRCNQENIVKT